MIVTKKPGLVNPDAVQMALRGPHGDVLRQIAGLPLITHRQRHRLEQGK